MGCVRTQKRCTRPEGSSGQWRFEGEGGERRTASVTGLAKGACVAHVWRMCGVRAVPDWEPNVERR